MITILENKIFDLTVPSNTISVKLILKLLNPVQNP